MRYKRIDAQRITEGEVRDTDTQNSSVRVLQGAVPGGGRM
jgi:hypothetical protein